MTNQTINVTLEAKNIGNYDTVVCGGGTAGVIAALASARNGSKTLLIEKGHYLGGMMTMGNAGLTKYVMHGIDDKEQYKINEELKTNPENVQIIGGIPLELTNKLIANNDALGTHGTGSSYVYTDSHAFKLLLFEELQKAGVKILLHSKPLKVIKDGSKITGVIFDTKECPMVAYAKYFIDTTGDGDLAYLAGAEYVTGAAEHDLSVKRGTSQLGLIDEIGSMYRIGGIDYEKFIKCLREEPGRFQVQSFGLMSKDELLESYERGDAIVARANYKYSKIGGFFQVYNYPREGVMIGCVCYNVRKLNCTNADELTESEYIVLKDADFFFDVAKKEFPGFENAYILDVPQAGVRETRHIMGEYLLNIVDLLNKVEFYDTIGFTSHPVDIEPKPAEHINRERAKRDFYRIPYRSLVAKGIDNLLLGGRLISSTREASGCIRVTTCCMMTGEAAGTAAAILTKDGGKAKDIDIEKLRNTLKNNGVKC